MTNSMFSYTDYIDAVAHARRSGFIDEKRASKLVMDLLTNPLKFFDSEVFAKMSIASEVKDDSPKDINEFMDRVNESKKSGGYLH